MSYPTPKFKFSSNTFSTSFPAYQAIYDMVATRKYIIEKKMANYRRYALHQAAPDDPYFFMWIIESQKQINELVVLTETRRAEVARAKPAILVASTHLWAKSLRSACKEQVNLAPAGSKPKALHTLWEDLNCRLVRVGTPTLVGCISVAAACNEAAIFFSSLLSLASECGGVSAYHLTNYRKGSVWCVAERE